MPTRRQMLAGIGVGSVLSLFGCTAVSDLREWITGDSSRTITIAEHERRPDDLWFRFDFELWYDSIDNERTSNFELVVLNDYEDRLNIQMPFHKGYSSQWGNEGITLWSTEAADAPSEEVALARVSGDDLDQRWEEVDEEPPIFSLGLNEYMVTMDPEASGCFPRREHRLDGEDVDNEDFRAESDAFDWGFSLEVE